MARKTVKKTSKKTETTTKKTILDRFGGYGKQSLATRLRLLKQQQSVVNRMEFLQERTPEQKKAIKESNRILTAVLTAHNIVDGRTKPFISNESGVVQYIQISPAFSNNTGVMDSGTRWWRLADVRLRVAKDPEHPNPKDYVRIGFSVNKNHMYNAPGHTFTYRPRLVNAEYAQATGLWVPKVTQEEIRAKVAMLGSDEWKERREMWGSLWAPYTDIIGAVVTLVMELTENGLLEVYNQKLFARTPEEEKELLTPVQGFDGDKVYETEIIPNIEKILEETEEKKELLEQGLKESNLSD